MNRIELLKQAKSALDSLVAKKNEQQSENSADIEATKLALLLESNQTIVDAVERTRLTKDDISEAVSVLKIEVPKIDAPQVTVNVPEIKMPAFPAFPNYPSFPEIKLPTINVPEPKVTVNIPDIKLPVINIPETVINFPTTMDVGLDRFTAKRPLPVMQVDPAGNYVSPVSGGGGPRRVKIDNNASEPIPISGTISATFSADFGSGEIGSQTLRTVQATNAIASVYVTGANGTIGVVTINPDGLPVYGGSGSASSVSVTDIFGTVGANVVNPDGRLKVELPTGSSGLTDTELRASAVPVSQVSGAVFSVSVTDIFGSTGTGFYNGDNRIRVAVDTGSSGLTDAELRATSLTVNQLSGSSWSTSVVDIFGTTATNLVNPDGRMKVELPTGSSGLTDTELRASHLDVQQVSGAIDSVNVVSMPSVTVTSITNSIATSILNGDGTTLDPRNRNWTITETVPISAGATLDVQQVSGASWSINVLSLPSVTVTSITNSVASSLVDSSGVQYSGSNPLPITWVSGAGVSTSVNISDSTGVGYSGSNPLPITGTVVVSSVTASTASALVDSSGVQYSGSNPIPTKEVRSVTPSQTSVSVTVASTSILAANTSRLGATIYNEGSATCYMKLGATASLTSYTLQIASGGYYEVPFGYTGAIDGITSASTAQLRITEIT